MFYSQAPRPGLQDSRIRDLKALSLPRPPQSKGPQPCPGLLSPLIPTPPWVRSPEAQGPLTPSGASLCSLPGGDGEAGSPSTACLLLDLEATASGSRHSFILAPGRKAGRGRGRRERSRDLATGPPGSAEGWVWGRHEPATRRPPGFMAWGQRPVRAPTGPRPACFLPSRWSPERSLWAGRGHRSRGRWQEFSWRPGHLSVLPWGVEG